MDWTEIEVVVKNQFEDNIVGILYLFDIDGINIKDSRDYEEFAKEKPYWVVLDEEDFEKSDFIINLNCHREHYKKERYKDFSDKM